MTPTTSIHHDTLSPQSASELATLLTELNEQKTPVALNPKDLIGHTADKDAGVILNLTPLTQVREYEPADLVITVETGITLKSLHEVTHAYGQQFPLTYPEETPLIEIISEDRPSPEAGILGYPRDFVLGMEIATPDGKLTKCGGTVMKNVTGYDLMKLYTGNHNTLGIITAVSLKLNTLPQATKTLSFQFKSIMQLVSSLSQLNFIHNQQTTITSITQLMLGIQNNTPYLMVGLQGFHTQVKQDEARLVQQLKTLDIHLSENTPSFFPNLSEKTLGVECVSATGEWVNVLNYLLECSTEEQPNLITIFPKAGLTHLYWDQTSHPISPESFKNTLSDWQQYCEQRGGFIQLSHIPIGFETLAKQYNLPQDPIIQMLHTRLKTMFDPNHILKSRRLPL